MSQTIPYSIVLTSVYSGDLGLQIIQRTSPEYPWIDSSAQWTVEACIPQFFFRGLSTYSLSLQCLVTLCILCLQWSLLTGHEGAGMTRILLTHSIRNPLSFLLIFFLIFSVFISSIPSESVNDMFWSMIVFLGASQWHYNLRLTERAKMTLSRAQNIAMPMNINFVLFHCKGPFGRESYLRRRLQICRTLRTFKCAFSLIRE